MRLFFLNIRRVLKRIQVFALIGESGTGKSFRAKLVAQKYNIDLIIDDGLLIKNNAILAGRSAKKDKTFLAAVKTALFDDKAHRDEIAKALQNQSFKKILILGTSEKMVKKIAARLQLPQIYKIIKIEDISTKDEIERAQRTRKVEGKHVIPVPSIEVKREYPHIFYDAVRVFFKQGQKNKPSRGARLYEKALVRPVYAQKGRVSISESALSQMALHCIDEFNPHIVVKKLVAKADGNGYRLIITIDVPFGTQLSGEIHNLQKYIIDTLERFTGILIEEVNIIIDRVTQTE